MISRSDWEPLPKPTLSPFARGYLSLCRFFTAAVWCVPALRVPLVHSNKPLSPKNVRLNQSWLMRDGRCAFSPFVQNMSHQCSASLSCSYLLILCTRQYGTTAMCSHGHVVVSRFGVIRN